MNDGDWEAVRGSDRDAKGDPDSEHAAAAAAPGRADSSVRKTDEVIVGWRAWGLAGLRQSSASKEKAGPLILTSTFMTDLWQPGKVMGACCGTHFLRHGIHAFVSRDQTQAYVGAGIKPARYVFGEVSLWGRVVIHEHGYRAAYAYPKRIFVPLQYQGGRDIVNELRRAYGIEVEWMAPGR